ncbi:actin-like ATPase domain-containing protein [Acephala macrosclerotiorum]|nr:actin-like ATPase domain-containing protein [Acephala macrosclerotiorum]
MEIAPITKDLPQRPKVEVSDTEDGEDEEIEDIIVIGIDFGTTFSGVAWATGEDFCTENVNVITSWPGYGREEGKAPTELFYEDDQVMWGYEVPVDAAPVQWFKLLLVKDEDLGEELRSSEFVLRGRKMLRENGKTAIELIADYLRALWKHVLDTITKARGESVVDALPLHVVITVPAIWKGYARESMKKAAKTSGILDRRAAGPTSMTFAPEPEAAALSTLAEPGRKLKAGDVYVICDAGGGTVDLITYQIDCPLNPIEMHEAVEGTGGLCGGIFIDQAFEDMCKARLGRKWDRLSKAGIKSIMKNEWEVGAKPEFKPSSKKDYIVAIPAEAFGGSRGSLDDTSKEPIIKSGRIHFKSSHIQKAFAQPFSDIEKLLDEQLQKTRDLGYSPTGIILVGGLGGSAYLYQALKTKYSKAGINILQSTGMRPRTAICRGAVYKGFMDLAETEGAASEMQQKVEVGRLDSNRSISITSTVSRLSFGLKFSASFDEERHLEADKAWDDEECKWKAENQMQWYLHRGENVVKKKPIRKSYYRIYKDNEFDGSLSIKLWQCDESSPPPRMTINVKPLCTINCTTTIPFSSLEDYTNPRGDKLKRLSYDVEMVPSGASVEFVVYINGERQEAQNANVHFQ